MRTVSARHSIVFTAIGSDSFPLRMIFQSLSQYSHRDHVIGITSKKKTAQRRFAAPSDEHSFARRHLRRRNTDRFVRTIRLFRTFRAPFALQFRRRSIE